MPLVVAAGPVAQGAVVLDTFEDASRWKVITSNQVSGALRAADGHQGRALCLDYDFNGVSGYVGLQRELPLDYPADYEFGFQLRGDSPNNDLQFKLVDDSGDNVWWVNRPRYVFPRQWTPVVYKQRHISRAWGPAPNPTLRHSRKVEFTMYNSAGGKGSVCFDSLTFRERPVETSPPPVPRATATPDAGAAHNATDADLETAWRAPVGKKATRLRLDLGRSREFGGLRLHWARGEAATRYRIALSQDGRNWTDVRAVTQGNGGMDPIALPESEGRFVRLELEAGEGAHYGLREITIEPLAFGATPNDFIKALATGQPRGSYPRGFHGEQPYWTVVGIDGGRDQGLIGEDGAIEVSKGGFSIEPFVVSEGKLLGWADVSSVQSLQDGYLPIPTVRWRHGDFALETTAFAHGAPENSVLVGRYRLTNTGNRARDYVLVLAARPFQVNPPSQFLNTVGGVSAITDITVQGGRLVVDGRQVVLGQETRSGLATTFEQGEVIERLREVDWSEPRFDITEATGTARDARGLASAALLYPVRLEAGESREFDWRTPLTGTVMDVPVESAGELQADAARIWHDKLDRVTLRVPAKGQHLVNTLRTGLAHMLISRTGPRLQPGTRSYARAWIRDGAMIAEGLLRMGREDVAEEFLRWYAPYQFENGKVPCCVDDRGSDPVPENDSHGELVFTVAELYRYTRDRELLEAMWPHVVGAVKYMDELRLSERTNANRATNPAFYGMMPASISHEGYSAKPMHSYWDNFWALRGYKDAVEIAQWLGKENEARAFAASRDQFRDDLYASIAAATKARGIDFIPGAAELGDFDATSTTIALAPGGEQQRLPQPLLSNTFERYWREFEARRNGTREWRDYTPYELRTVGTFVRLGWRDRAHGALDFFFDDQQPRGWNQWAEVVSRTPRKPFFVGDLPHAWVESDYVRSVLDMFAYTREDDDALVVAAGIPADWLEGEGVEVSGLRTPYGALAYSMRSRNGELAFDMPAGLWLPKGGVVIALPPEWREGRVRVDGKAVQVRDGELRLQRLPAHITVDRR
ncbi:discoidin domain-containing protein [Lysobacter niabensis]|uniref:discoidin domain-containing protein n=1 Tax=Agrilutibacter niabensis TaxID=380628 RepID=UPI00361A40BE